MASAAPSKRMQDSVAEELDHPPTRVARGDVGEALESSGQFRRSRVALLRWSAS